MQVRAVSTRPAFDLNTMDAVARFRTRAFSTIALVAGGTAAAR